jgi:hypothetical protein
MNEQTGEMRRNPARPCLIAAALSFACYGLLSPRNDPTGKDLYPIERRLEPCRKQWVDWKKAMVCISQPSAAADYHSSKKLPSTTNEDIMTEHPLRDIPPWKQQNLKREDEPNISLLMVVDNAPLEGRFSKPSHHTHTSRVGLLYDEVQSHMIQSCFTNWTLNGAWRSMSAPVDVVGSSSPYGGDCELYSGNLPLQHGGCAEAQWTPRANGCAFEEVRSHSMDMAGPLQPRTWVHFLGDSSLRIIYSAFISHISPRQLDRLQPSHDFCYQDHRSYDGCSEVDSALDSKLMEPCFREFQASRFEYERVSFYFATAMRFFSEYFSDSLTLAGSRRQRVLPDVLIIKNGAWEFFGYKVTSIDNRSDYRAGKYSLTKNLRDGLNTSEYINEMRHFVRHVNQVYRLANQTAALIWILGVCDSTSPDVHEENVHCGEVSEQQRAIKNELIKMQQALPLNRLRGTSERPINVRHFYIDLEPMMSPLPKEYHPPPYNPMWNVKDWRCHSFSYVHRPGLFADQTVKILANAFRVLRLFAVHDDFV